VHRTVDDCEFYADTFLEGPLRGNDDKGEFTRALPEDAAGSARVRTRKENGGSPRQVGTRALPEDADGSARVRTRKETGPNPLDSRLRGNDDTGEFTHALPEDALAKNAKAALDQELVIIYGACYSGSFIPALSGEGRVVITSASADEISYRGVLNQDTGVRDGEFFLMEFFRNAGAGRTLMDSFELACAKTSDYTNARSNGGAGEVPQHPLLDDNGDGTGASGVLSPVAGEDGGVAHGLDLGLGANAGTGISWFTATPPQFIGVNGGIGEAVAEVTGRAPLPGDDAWLEIKPPWYDNGQVATPGYESFQRVAAMIGPIAPTELRDLGGGFAYAWTQQTLLDYIDFYGFYQPGTYKLYYFLRDGDTGQVGSYLVTNVYVEQEGNTAPNPVSLIYPLDGAVYATRPVFAWNATIDPDGDDVTYHVQISEDPAFPEADTRVYTTADTVYQLAENQELRDLARYYWRVVPVDNYGAKPPLHEERTFTTDNTNPQVPGALHGFVQDADTKGMITGAAVRVLPTGETALSNETGRYFLGNLQQGVYALEVNATGYETLISSGASVQSGRMTTKDLLLAYAGGNRPPVLGLIGDRSVIAGERLEIAFTGEDPDAGSVLTWSLLNAPPYRMNVDAQTGLFVYEPVSGDEGHHDIVVLVTDDGDPPLSDSEAVTITVEAAPPGEFAYIQGPGKAEVGSRVALTLMNTGLAGEIQYQWYYESSPLPDAGEASYVIESVTFDHAGIYEAHAWTDTKSETVTAEFELVVVEAMPLETGAALAMLIVIAAAGIYTAGSRWKKGGQRPESRPDPQS
jgi:hypothetical protein